MILETLADPYSAGVAARRAGCIDLAPNYLAPEQRRDWARGYADEQLRVAVEGARGFACGGVRDDWGYA
jgi:hypothetical protein